MVCPKQFPSLSYVPCKPCTDLVSRFALFLNGLNELQVEPRLVGVPLGASKMISEPMLRSAQTVQLYCSNTNTFSKRTKTRF
jgi:hypothetical protein